MSEELENSLQQAIESYFGERLRVIDEQVSRLQTEFSEALARLRESSAPESLDMAPVTDAIAAHLQTAREQKLSGATAWLADLTNIRQAAAEIEKQQSQANVLSSLLKGAIQFAERAVLFVIKNEQAIGWRACEASDTANLESIRVTLPLTAETLVTRAVRSRSTETAEVGSNSEDRLLTDQLGGEPQTAAAVPLVVRGKVVAVLYADSPSPDQNAINVVALDLLTRIAGMAVNVLSASRGAQPAPARESQTAAAPARAELPAEAAQLAESQAEPSDIAAAERREAERAYSPQIEPQIEPPASEQFRGPVGEEAAEPPTEAAVTETRQVDTEPQVSMPITQVSTPVTSDVSPAEQMSPSPAFAPSYAAPLGSARRYGVTEPELPIEVGEEERRLHNDARRFARLLVSEIKLYNEQKVKEGRSGGNIYDRLREDIDRSRQMYDKRVAPPVAARHDYFHQELVNTLAEGDPAKLGASYPGAVMAST